MTNGSAFDPHDITTKAELAAGLTALRRRADLSIRELARRTGLPSATLGGYFSGRNLPQPGQLTTLRVALAACGVPAEGIDAWIAATERVRATPAARPASPYPGLASFDVDDAAVFFGRADEVAEVLTHLEALRDGGPGDGSTLAVIGPSGSGKTSLLRAGVAAALSRPGSGWACEVMTPGTDPAAALADALGRLGDAGRDRAPVLVVDQFEEVFAAATPAEQRAALVADLVAPGPGVLVAIGMRADFYAAAASEPALVPVLRQHQVLLGPLDDAGLRDSIVRPAESVGLGVEDGLVDLVSADLAPRDSPGEAHDAGALPLLSHALRVAWERGAGRSLSIADYREAGGIDGAIQSTAEEAYEAVPEVQRDLVRALFLRLVTIDDVAVTRRRVTGAELSALREAGHRTIIDEFVSRRLLTAGVDSLEISHEALLSAWPRLGEWVDEDRIGLKLHRQVTEAANAWAQGNRDDALLLRGTRLDTAAAMVAQPTPRTSLTAVERDFVETSVAARDAALDRARHVTQRLRRQLAAVATLFVVAAALAGFALSARSTADTAEREAATARDLALSRQIAGQAKQLQDSDPALGQQLALAAYRKAGSDLARSALVDQSSQPEITRVLGAQGPTSLAVGTGTEPLIAVSHADDGSVHLYRLAGQRVLPLGVVPARDRSPNEIYALRLSPDGRVLALSGQSRVVRLWDVADPQRPRPLAALRTTFTGDVQSLDFSRDGTLLAAGAAGPSGVLLWDVRTPARPAPVTVPGQPAAGVVVSSVRFSPSGTALAAATQAPSLIVWPVRGRAVAQPRSVTAGESALVSVAWMPDGARLLAGNRRGEIAILAASTLAPTRAPVSVSAGYVNAIDIAPDGSRFAVATSDTAVSQWSTETWTQLSTQGNPGPVTGVGYTLRGTVLLSTAADGTLRRYAADSGIPVDASVFNLAFAEKGRLLGVATGGLAPGVRLWDVGNPARPRAVSPLIAPPAAAGAAAATVALTPDGDVLAIGTRTGNVVLWDIRDPARPRLLGRPLTVQRDAQQVESVTFSADGRSLLAGGDDGTVRVIDVRDPRQPRQVATLRTGGFVFFVSYSPDGSLVAAASADGHGYVWDVHDPVRPTHTAQLGGFASYVYAVAFSPDGRTLAVSSADHTTRLWRVTPTGRTTPFGPALIGPSGYVYSVAFNPDGTRLATASDDDAVRVYDVRGPSPARVPQLTLDSSGNSMFAAFYSPDGRYLYGGGRGRSLSIWTVDVDAYAATLCRDAGTPITRDEWAINVPGARYDRPCR